MTYINFKRISPAPRDYRWRSLAELGNAVGEA